MRFGLVSCNYPTYGDLADFYSQQLEQVIQAEKNGFEAALVCEHHFTENHLPSPLIAAAGFATRTSRIKIGTGVLLLPLHNPIRVAEDATLVDVISKGRLILGVGHGYRVEEFSAFDVSLKDRIGRLEEGANLIRRLWTTDKATFHGKYFDVKDVNLTPKPVQKPHPPIWVAAKSEGAVKQAARVGDAWFSDPVTPLKVLKQRYAVYKETLKKHGKDFYALERPLLREGFVTTGGREGWTEVKPHALVVYGEYYKWGHLLDEEGHPVDPKTATIDEFAEKLRERFINGNPEECIEQIDRCRKELEITWMLLRLQFPGMPHPKVLETIRRFGEKVIPYFKEK